MGGDDEIEAGNSYPRKVEKIAMMTSSNLLKELFHMPGSSTVVFSLRAFKKDLTLPEMSESLQSCCFLKCRMRDVI